MPDGECGSVPTSASGFLLVTEWQDEGGLASWPFRKALVPLMGTLTL
jgi:hypothetical protein